MYLLLRTFMQTGIQEDQVIGRKYETIYRKTNPEEFMHSFRKLHPNCANLEEDDNVFALIREHREDGLIIELYKTHRYYIVSDNGNTYANITYRK